MRHDLSIRRTALWLGLAAALVGFSGAAAAEGAGSAAGTEGAAGQGSVLTITGTVETLGEGEAGDAAVRVVSPTFGSFRVQDAGKGAELKEHVGERVTITARRQMGGDGKPVWNVEHYRVHEG